MDNEGWRDWAKNSAGMWDWKSLCWTLFPLGDEKCSVRTLTTVKEETRLKLPFLSAILRYRVLKNTRFYSLNGCLFCKCGLHEFAKKRFIQTAHWHWRSPCYTVFNKFLTTFWWFLTQQIKLQNMNVKWLRKTESQQKVSKKISKKPLSKIHKTWSQCPPLTDAYCSCAHNLTKHVTTKNCGKRVWLFNQTFKSSCVFFPQSLTRPSVNKQILKGKNIVLLQIEQFC